jgi:hypothetical protein
VKQNEKPSSRCDRVRVVDESDLRIVLVRKQNVLEVLICLMFRNFQFLCEGDFLVNGQSEYRRDGAIPPPAGHDFASSLRACPSKPCETALRSARAAQTGGHLSHSGKERAPRRRCGHASD